MKVVICGGRWYHFTKDDFHLLTTLHTQYGFTLVVTGGAIGADKDGELWAKLQRIPTLTFPPDWDRHGRSAGPIRNAVMLDFLAESPQGMVIAFPGGSGTADCVKQARRRGLVVVSAQDGRGDQPCDMPS